MATKDRAAELTKAAEDVNPRVDVAASLAPLWEVLTEAPNGFRTVHRFRAADEAVARAAVDVPDGGRVLATAPAGLGFGSGDRPERNRAGVRAAGVEVARSLGGFRRLGSQGPSRRLRVTATASGFLSRREGPAPRPGHTPPGGGAGRDSDVRGGRADGEVREWSAREGERREGRGHSESQR
jgi:hypothetical protein